jgi:hypothetical protein
VRNCRPAEQRLWLGSDRYRRGGRDPFTNCNAESYANRNSYGFCLWRDNAYTDADADLYTYSDCNTHSYSNANRYSDGHSYSYSNAQTHAHAQVCGDTEASSHTAA